MSEKLRLKCVDPTQTLTEGRVYVSDRTIREEGIACSHFVDWDEATHVIITNDKGKTIRVYSERFEKVNEQEKSKTSSKG